MITAMRKYLKGLHILLWVVVGAFVATIFFVWGKGSQSGGNTGANVAAVNGETISVERYDRAYQRAMTELSRMYGGKLTPEMAERMGLRQQVVDGLVRDLLVVQRAQKEGLLATDEEVNVRIQALPVFQDNGVFSVKRYEDLLRRNRLTTAVFEAEVRQGLTLAKVQRAIRDGAKISDGEVEQAFNYRNEKARAAWALVELAPIVASVAAADADVEAYYQEHSAQFHRPDRRRVQYVVFAAKDSLPVISEADVQTYYDEHSAEFENPLQVEAAHVLVRVPDTGGSEAEAKAKAKVQEVISRAKGGEDFAKLAREVSEDPGSAGSGGALGWVSKGQMVPQFETAVFALKKGELTSEPVRSPFGYHAIKVSDIRGGDRKTLKDATPQIRAKLLTERIDKESLERATQARSPLQNTPDFMAEAQRLGLEPREMTIARPEGPRAVERTELLQRAAFDVAVGGLSEPIKTPNGYFLVKVLEQKPAAVPPLAEIKDEVANAFKRSRADAIALERATKLAAAARTGDLLALAKRDGVPSGETKPFTRRQPPDRLTAEAAQAAFQQESGTVSEPVKTGLGYFVVKPLERIPADQAELTREREQLTRELLEAKRAQTWDSWIATARAETKVEVYDQPRSRE